MKQRNFGRHHRLAVTSMLLLALGLCWTPLSQAQTASESTGCYVDGLSERLRCGTIRVPEDPQKPEGRQLAIHYAVLPAIKNTAPNEAVLAIAGGPGQSAIENAATFNLILSKVRQNRDILLIDQRGTGQSNALECAALDLEQTLAYNDEALDVEQETRNCLSKLDADISQYGSEQALHDFEAVRRHLGYQKLHLYGISYGSRMAQLYMRHYPEALKTVTLDGVVPMQQSVLAIGAAIGRAQDLLLSDCEQDALCAQTYPQLRQELNQLAERLGQHAVMKKVPHPVTGDIAMLTLTRSKLLGSLRMALYSPSVRALLPYAIHRAAMEEYQPLLGLMALSVDSTGIAMGMHAAVVCGEDWPRLTAVERQQAKASVIGKEMLRSLDRSCPIWNIPAAAATFAEPIASNIPTLLLSGAKDPATPPSWGDLAMAELSNARHLISPYATHGVAAQSCANELIAELVKGTAPDKLDGECLNKDVRRSFYLNASTVEAIPGGTK
ncbi:alpha/beta fold hydrolase [Shewanella algae]|uniref:alpha/beta hydrolase n=1 Tax=Shewanella algae TaxID=38313 RepID=UPI001AAD8C66|nr:alpha/beta fold hydrolase [Shewanella algae]